MKALIGLQIDMHAGHKELSLAIQALSDSFKFLQVSNVYETQNGKKNVVVLFEVEADGDAILKVIESEVHINAILLILDNIFISTPNLTLPSAELVSKPEWLMPATEVLPHYIHPVINKTLAEVAAKYSGKSWGVFVVEGKRLLDF